MKHQNANSLVLTLDCSKVESPHESLLYVTVRVGERRFLRALLSRPESLSLQMGEQGRVRNSDPELEDA